MEKKEKKKQEIVKPKFDFKSHIMDNSVDLRAGFSTKDMRLDRVPIFDQRSRDYSIVKSLPSQKLVSKTWECLTTLDQGKEGACVGFGLAHELLCEPVAAPPYLVNAAYAKKNIYWEAQKIDKRPGGSYPGARPKYEGTSMLAGVKVLKNLGWITGYDWSFSVNDLALGIGHYGPAVIGVIWTDSMYDTDENGFVHPKEGYIIGGHCILCRGVNVAEKYFILRNSWGKEFGNKGDCYISFEDMDYLLHMNGESVFLKGRKLIS